MEDRLGHVFIAGEEEEEAEFEREPIEPSRISRPHNSAVPVAGAAEERTLTQPVTLQAQPSRIETFPSHDSDLANVPVRLAKYFRCRSMSLTELELIVTGHSSHSRRIRYLKRVIVQCNYLSQHLSFHPQPVKTVIDYSVRPGTCSRSSFKSFRCSTSAMRQNPRTLCRPRLTARALDND